MTVEKEFAEGKLTLKVCGRLDTNTSPMLEELLKLDGVTEVVFDFTGLEYISSAGLRILMMVQKSMIASDGKMMIAHPNKMVTGVLDMTGLSGMLTIV